jgi:glycine/D-amino acid oxidase-like deaminating enzyme
LNGSASNGPELPPSLWAAVTPAGPPLPALEDHQTCDVIIIGAGFTGLSAALALREAGVTVTVLEAAEPGWGASGRNNGQVIPTLSKLDPDDLIKMHGDSGERLVRLIRDSAADLFTLLRTHGINAEAEQTGWVQPVHTPGRIRIAERRHAQWSRHGAPVELLSRDETRAMLGSDAWHGGFWNPTGGHINPLALSRGLACVALAHGAQIFARSPALSIAREQDQWVVQTPRGSVRSSGLLLATNAYTDHASKDLAPAIAREIVPVVSWQMATQPLNHNQRGHILPGRQAMSDTHGDLYFARYDSRHRLVTGGALANPFAGPEALRPLIAARLQRLFPEIGEVTFDYIWNGYISMTADFAPRMHVLGPNGFAWAGCNGRGVALAVALGRELAKALTGHRLTDLALPFTEPRPLPFQSAIRKLAPLMLMEYRRRDAREIA